MTSSNQKTPQKIALIAGFNSYLACGLKILNLIAPAQKIDVLVVGNGQSELLQEARSYGKVQQFGELGQLLSRVNLQKYDQLIIGLSRANILSLIDFFHSRPNKARPRLIGYYAGLNITNQIDNFLQRSSLDLLLVNSPVDETQYKTLCSDLNLENNALLFGLPNLLGLKQRKRHPHEKKKILFTEQTIIPESNLQRRYILEQLIDLAHKYPDKEFLIKPRHRDGDSTAHPNRRHIEALFNMSVEREQLPSNFQITYESLDSLYSEIDLLLTISSTTALEAIHQKINVALVSDFSLREQYGNAAFLGSGLLYTFNELKESLNTLNYIPDPQWQAANILEPSKDILKNIEGRLQELRLFQGSEIVNIAYFEEQKEFIEYKSQSGNKSKLARFFARAKYKFINRFSKLKS